MVTKAQQNNMVSANKVIFATESHRRKIRDPGKLQ